MRILFVADFASEHLGYQEIQLAVAVARLGHEVQLVTSCWNPPAPDYEKSFEPLLGPRRGEPRTYSFEGVTVQRLPVIFSLRDRVFLKGLKRACERFRPDIIFVHLNFTVTAIRMAVIAKRLGVPLYYDNHSIRSVQNLSLPSRVAYIAYNRLLRFAVIGRTTRFFGVANECVDFLREVHGIPGNKVQLLPLGVNLELFHPDHEKAAEWRKCIGAQFDDFVIVQTGKLDRTKDPLTLASAVSKMSESGRPLHLVFVGGGPEEYVRHLDQVATQHSGVQVHYLPPVRVADLSQVFSGSDVVCFPGGTSMSALEAAACGSVVIMNDEPVSSWRAANGVGLTFPQGDSPALALILDELRGLPKNKLQEMGKVAQQAVTSKFSYERIAQDLVNQFVEDLMQGSTVS